MNLHPAGFVETEVCDGPRYVRGQPSRETGGVIMTNDSSDNNPDVSFQAMNDKYVTNWNLPFRNLVSFVEEMEDQWTKLSNDQKYVISNMLTFFITKHPDVLTNKSFQLVVNKNKENFSQPDTTFENISDFIKSDDSNIDKILNLFQTLYNDKLNNWIKNNWEQNYIYINNLRTTIIIIFIILMILIGILIGWFIK